MNLNQIIKSRILWKTLTILILWKIHPAAVLILLLINYYNLDMYYELQSININQHLSATVNINQHLSATVNINQHLSATININQHLSATINIYQHLSFYQQLSTLINLYQQLSTLFHTKKLTSSERCTPAM
jgi:hypothetical protein